MWNLDLAFADIAATSSDPNLGAIRLAWWRERLVKLDDGEVPAEPRLQAVFRELLPRGVTGCELSRLEDAWRPLIEPLPWKEKQADGLRLRGQILFGTGARLLGWEGEDGAAAGILWSLVDGARNCRDFYSRTFLLAEARKAVAELPIHRPPRQLRPLTVLAALAAHDVLRGKPLDVGGGFGRIVVATIHQARGTLPRG